MKIEIDFDITGQRLRLVADNGRAVIHVEYDAATRCVLVWDMTKMDDTGPEITVAVDNPWLPVTTPRERGR